MKNQCKLCYLLCHISIRLLYRLIYFIHRAGAYEKNNIFAYVNLHGISMIGLATLFYHPNLMKKNSIKTAKAILKRVSAVIMVAVLLCACSRQPEIRIGVSQNSSDDWREKMNREMMLELYQHPEATLEIRSAENDNQRQISDIEYFIDRKVDVLIVSPREAEALTPVISKAHRSGIKVLVFDRETNNEEYDLFYGADNNLIGRNVAVYATRYLRPGHTVENPLKILEIRGLDGSSPAEGRHKGFADVVKTEPRIKVVASVGTDWTEEPAARITDSLLHLYPEIELIYAHNDRMGLAAAEVCRNHGRSDIHILGVDGAPEIGLKGVSDNKLDATFIYPTNGDEIFEDAIDLATGVKKPKQIVAKCAMAIDKSNVDLQLLSARTLNQALDNVNKLNARVTSYAETNRTYRILMWAVLALLVMAAAVSFLVLRLYWTRKRTQAMLAQRNETLRTQRDDLEKLNTQLNEATSSKLNFFTNVSHDLRTPLTLISTPLETVADAPDLSERNKGLLSMAVKNVKILQRLINQILDFQKYESGKLSVNLEETNITAAFREWTAAFQGAARKKDLRLTLSVEPDVEMMGAVDREKFERIYFNLMSNAFRYTPSNGHIKVTLFTDNPNELRFSIADSGRGIPADQIPHLFERFFRGSEVHSSGSGIGLVVVKSFVEMHGGRIDVASEPGKGTVFTVTIPVKHVEQSSDLATKSSQSFSYKTQDEITSEIGNIELSLAPDNDSFDDNGKPTVLVVDDNDDLRNMVRVILDGDYNVITAPSGESGIRMATKYVPDCIVSDVMMPGIDGLELTRRIKGEAVTSHIPVILLTACALDEQKIAGYSSGADGYLSKPFNGELLRARIASVIENRARMKAHPGAEVPVPELPRETKKSKKNEPVRSSADPFSELDSTFYRNFVAMVNKEMGNAELSVEEMAAKIGMSRVQFYRKLKALTNYSPADLLRLFRLRKAKEILMSDDETTVAEVAYKVGFSSPSYFAKCFKDQFGELPSELQGRTSKMQG